jgi:hypothetical protein
MICKSQQNPSPHRQRSSRISYYIKTILMSHPSWPAPPATGAVVPLGYARLPGTAAQLSAGARLARHITTAGIAHMSMVSNLCVSHHVPGVIVPIRVSRDRQNWRFHASTWRRELSELLSHTTCLARSVDLHFYIDERLSTSTKQPSQQETNPKTPQGSIELQQLSQSSHLLLLFLVGCLPFSIPCHGACAGFCVFSVLGRTFFGRSNSS